MSTLTFLCCFFGKFKRAIRELPLRKPFFFVKKTVRKHLRPHCSREFRMFWTFDRKNPFFFFFFQP